MRDPRSRIREKNSRIIHPRLLRNNEIRSAIEMQMTRVVEEEIRRSAVVVFLRPDNVLVFSLAVVLSIYAGELVVDEAPVFFEFEGSGDGCCG